MSDILRSQVHVCRYTLKVNGTEYKEYLEKDLEFLLADKLFDELKSKKTLLVSLIADKECNVVKGSNMIIHSDVKVLTVDEIISLLDINISKTILSELSSIAANNSAYKQGIEDTISIIGRILGNTLTNLKGDEND